MDSPPRLPLTLISHAMWSVNVRTALPDRWDEIRHEAYRRAGHRCEACGGTSGGRPLQAHEYFSYAGDRQVLLHIACLCDVCHSATHLSRTRSFSGSNRVAKEALEKLAEVNGWTIRQAAEYAQRELALCEERGSVTYRLDLSVLQRDFGIDVPSEYRADGGSRGLLGRLLGAAR